MRAMKDSGIKWIGEIPESWESIYLKYFFNFEKGRNAALYTKEYCGENLGEYPVYSGQTENEGVLGKILNYDYDFKECLFTTTVGAKAMSLKVLNGRFSLSQNCLIMICKKIDIIVTKYVFYSLNPLFQYERALIPSYMQPSLRIEDLSKYKLIIPCSNEQQIIANFLDNKCEKIDRLIALLEEMIEELKAYKQSVITEAVTKGLDTTVPMKDSGIEWIGEIPYEWNVVSLKHLVKLNENTLSEQYCGDILYIDIGSVNNCGEISNIQEFAFTDAPSRARRIAKENDVIISTVRTYLKAIARIPKQYDGYICSTGFAVLTPKTINAHYLYYVLFTDTFTSRVELFSNGISYPAINSSQLSEISVIVTANKNEQKKIADYLDKKCAEIDNLISIKQSKINELKEYKKSLIYEYVTGKKEVI